MVETLLGVLKKYWGFDSFFPQQLEAMQCVLENRDSVVVFPTGGGKSLCFQAPALCMDGLAVVVSPLISLMKDQVDALRSCGVPAACINSVTALDDRRTIADQIRSGTLRLLYVAPERLLTDRTLAFLRTVDVSFFAIDEAHCISSWGHAFRPEYRCLSALKEQFPNVDIHAYTATATEKVRTDIAQQLGLVDPQVLVGSFDRPNLVYTVQRRNNGLAQIASVLDRHRGESGIVYCITRANVDRTCTVLNDLGYSALPYHAGMLDDDRQRNQDAFIEERADTIVATVAFGMGIDKSNVRYVVHAGMPKSLEAYQQESGRAGRDGLEAECWLFYSGGDYGTWKRIIEQNEPDGCEGMLWSLNAMYNFCTGVECRHRALVHYFAQSLEESSCEACDVCLGKLDLVEEPLVVGQKILSCVLRVDERFGGDYVSMILSGSQEKRIVANGHDRLSTWGILASENRRAIRDWIEQLVGQDFLCKTGEYNVLRVTDQGWRLLRGEITPRLMRPATREARKAATFTDSWEGVDRGLFDQLRDLRREKAVARQVPAYIVFSDAALRDMARRRPSTLERFREVYGVGDQKTADFGADFIGRIQDYCAANSLTMDETVDAGPAPSRPQVEPIVARGPSASGVSAFKHFDA